MPRLIGARWRELCLALTLSESVSARSLAAGKPQVESRGMGKRPWSGLSFASASLLLQLTRALDTASLSLGVSAEQREAWGPTSPLQAALLSTALGLAFSAVGLEATRPCDGALGCYE
jgi:hypothetical protein